MCIHFGGGTKAVFFYVNIKVNDSVGARTTQNFLFGALLSCLLGTCLGCLLPFKRIKSLHFNVDRDP